MTKPQGQTQMTLPATPGTTPIQEARIIHRPYQHHRSILAFNHHLVSLMLAIRDGQSPVITRSSTLTRPGNARASISWKTPQGEWSRFHSEDGQYHHPHTTDGTLVADLDTQAPWCDLVDKLLTAITRNCHVKTSSAGRIATLSWDRASHGNTPTILLTPGDRMAVYRDWPSTLPEHLEPPHTPIAPASPFYDHIKPLHRDYVLHVQTQHQTDTPATCQVVTCPNIAQYNALDHRGHNEGPLCNYHLYGPGGFAHRPPFQTFRQWLSRTLETQTAMHPLEHAAHQQRVSRWTTH